MKQLISRKFQNTWEHGTQHLPVPGRILATIFLRWCGIRKYPYYVLLPCLCSAFPKKVRENNIKVVITGEGADEMLAGYDIFKEGIIREFWSRAAQFKIQTFASAKTVSLSGTIQGKEQEYAQILFWLSASGYCLPFLFSYIEMEKHIRYPELFLRGFENCSQWI